MDEYTVFATDPLRRAYRFVTCVVNDPQAPPMVLQARCHNRTAAELLRQKGLASAIFLSAHNPWGVALPEAENRRRHAELRHALRAWPLLEGFCANAGGGEGAQAGFLVLCDDLELQTSWMQRFQQNAALGVSAQGAVEWLSNPHPLFDDRPRAPLRQSMGTVSGPEGFEGFAAHQRLCYYPSSGTENLWAVMDLDCDLFVFSDVWRKHQTWERLQADFAKHRRPLQWVAQGPGFVEFRSQGKTGLLFWEDNNQVLDCLYAAGLKVHHFVGICDGCCEGGNHECVHDRPFVRRLLRVASDGMAYTTDHSRPLQGFRRNDGWGMWHTREFLDRLALRHFPEPDPLRRPRWPEVDSAPDAVFALQGVLVKASSRDETGRLPLYVLPKGEHQPTQLERLRPFRQLAGRGILAEYRVFLENDPQACFW